MNTIKQLFRSGGWTKRCWVVAFCLQFSIFNFQSSVCYAQKAGDIISGTVSDAFGPVMQANVVEIDGANRIVAACLTDMNG